MPYGGNDWLALTQEPTLEPELPICDAHHHFWDLRPERIPYQRYLLCPFRTLFRTSEAILEEPPAERGVGAIYRLLHMPQPIAATLVFP